MNLSSFFIISDNWHNNTGIAELKCCFYRSRSDNVRSRVFIKEPNNNSGQWVIMLHGHGSLGDQLFVRPDLRDVWLKMLTQSGVGIIAPDLRANAWMCPEAVEDLGSIISEIRSSDSKSSFALLGGSMGGTGALIYAALHPEDIEFVAAYCPATDLAKLLEYLRGGGLENREISEEICQSIENNYAGADKTDLYRKHSVLENYKRLTMPLAIVHGDKDMAIPVEHSRRLRNLMKASQLFYKEIPDGGHDAPLSHTEPIELMIEHFKKG